MKILIMTGSYPPDVCGTADYSARLCEALQAQGVEAKIFYRKQWALRYIPGLTKDLRDNPHDLLHVQYPTTGYGRHLSPQIVGPADGRMVVTLHEASQSHILRQVSLYPFLLFGKSIIFTNNYERQHVEKLAPWIGSRSTTIPIGNNIAVAQPRKKLPNTVTCFSIIRPEKGLEEVIAMARVFRQAGSLVRVRIAGALMPRWDTYYKELLSLSMGLPVDWVVNPSDENLSTILAESLIAYLPYPDGASERRSSLVALLMNSCCVLTTIGQHTPQQMRDAVVGVHTPAEAAKVAMQLLDSLPEIERIAAGGRRYAERFEWQSIARQHIAVYEACLRARKKN